MSVRHHTDADAFLAAAAPVMARSAAVAASLRARAAALDAPAFGGETLTYAATYDGGGRHGVALRRADGPVLLEASDPEAAAAFADELAALAPTLQGVVGTLAACEAFARRWRERTRRPHVLRLHLRNHVLTAVASVPQPAGQPRVAVDGDRDWIVAAQVAFAAEARIPEAAADIAALVPARLARGAYWIWDDGGAQAYAGWWAAGADAARIGPVYTLPAARGRGYATALVAALARNLVDRGRRQLFLVTDMKNPTSNAIYARVGFRPLDEFFHFDFVAAA